MVPTQRLMAQVRPCPSCLCSKVGRVTCATTAQAHAIYACPDVDVHGEPALGPQWHPHTQVFAFPSGVPQLPTRTTMPLDHQAGTTVLDPPPLPPIPTTKLHTTIACNRTKPVLPAPIPTRARMAADWETTTLTTSTRECLMAVVMSFLPTTVLKARLALSEAPIPACPVLVAFQAGTIQVLAPARLVVRDRQFQLLQLLVILSSLLWAASNLLAALLVATTPCSAAVLLSVEVLVRVDLVCHFHRPCKTK